LIESRWMLRVHRDVSLLPLSLILLLLPVLMIRFLKLLLLLCSFDGIVVELLPLTLNLHLALMNPIREYGEIMGEQFELDLHD
jgi:hypothetical protein